MLAVENQIMDTLTLDALNDASPEQALGMLDGLYEHSPWIAEQALAARPFASVEQLRRCMVEVLARAPEHAQLALIRAHPELAGKAMVAQTLTSESTSDQQAAGLTACSPEEFARIQELNAAYNARFGFPFILCVGQGSNMDRAGIIARFARRLENTPADERAQALHQINRIVSFRLAAKFGLPYPDADNVLSA